MFHPFGLYGIGDYYSFSEDHSQVDYEPKHYKHSISNSISDKKQSDLRIISDSRPLFRHDDVLRHYITSNPPPPTPDSIYSVKEQGCSNPRYLRFTLNSIPTDNSLYNSIGLPLAAVWQPFAETGPTDDLIPVILSAPFRCSSCFAYINSFFKQIDNNRKIVCNICGQIQNTPENLKTNHAEHPELNFGTYEFVAPKEFSNRPAQVPLFLFCVDLSFAAVSLGLHIQVIDSIQAVLDYMPFSALIGVIFFDDLVHLFKLGNSEEIIEIISNDIEDPFISEPAEACCYDVVRDRRKLNILLEKLKNYSFFTSDKQTISVGSLLNGIKEYMLKSRGGRLLLFTSQSGNTGKNILEIKPETKPNHYENEKLYRPDQWYQQLGQECCENDICIDIFACTHQQVCLSSLAAICKQTGGDFYYFYGFQREADGEKLYYNIARILTRPQCFQVSIKVRISNGLSVDYFIGKYKRKGPIEMEIAALDSDKSFGIVLKYNEKLRIDTDCFIQCAMVYTNYFNERIIRIFNGKVNVTQSVLNVLNNADVDALSNMFLRISANNIFELSLYDIRESLQTSLIKVILAYQQTIQNFELSKFVIPDSLKMLILYTNSSLKLPGLTMTNTSKDSRLNSIYSILSIPVLSSRLLLYPKTYSLHDIMSQDHQPGRLVDGIIKLPNLIPNVLSMLKSDGVYLITNGDVLCFYIGRNVSNSVIIKF